MTDFATKVHGELGGDTLTIESGGAIHIKTGAKFLNNAGTQTAAITAPTGGTTVDAEARTAITAIIAALQAAGITA